MTDPVAGSFSGLHATVSLAGSRDYVVTKGGYSLKQMFDTPWPSADAFKHNVPTGYELASLTLERQMLDDTFVSKIATATPTTGTVVTVVTAGASLNTAGPLTLVGGSGMASGNGILALTTAGAITTNAGTVYIPVVGTDINSNIIEDVFTIPAATAIGTVIKTSKVFATVASISVPVALGASVTAGIASLAGATTYSPSSPGALINVIMKIGPHPITGRMVQATFNNCYIQDAPVDFTSGKTISQKITLVMQNPNTDMSFQSA